MKAMILKDMNKIDSEDKMERDQDKLAENINVVGRSLEVNTVKDILSYSHKYFDTMELLTLCV